MNIFSLPGLLFSTHPPLKSWGKGKKTEGTHNQVLASHSKSSFATGPHPPTTQIHLLYMLVFFCVFKLEILCVCIHYLVVCTDSLYVCIHFGSAKAMASILTHSFICASTSFCLRDSFHPAVRNIYRF